MKLFAALLACLPTIAFAGGYIGKGAVGVVEVPCYPEDRFHLCTVPVPFPHHPGYLPRSVPHVVELTPATPSSFLILVTPNIVPYEIAIGEAAAAAANFCGKKGPETVLARIDYRERYAEERLESWKFGGTCE